MSRCKKILRSPKDVKDIKKVSIICHMSKDVKYKNSPVTG